MVKEKLKEIRKHSMSYEDIKKRIYRETGGDIMELCTLCDEQFDGKGMKINKRKICFTCIKEIKEKAWEDMEFMHSEQDTR